MSRKHPIISITGSSGAGTTSGERTFEQIFHREGVNAVYIEGDAFHRYDRTEMRAQMAHEADCGNKHFSHFSPQTNLFEDLEQAFRDYGETGTAVTRHYVHDEEEAARHGSPPGTFTPWKKLTESSDLLFYEGLHGARSARGYSTEAVTDTILRRMPDYVHYICPQFTETDINFQRVPTVDTSNPFVARWIPTPDESMVVIRFRDPHGIDFPYLLSMIHNSLMSRANSIVIPGGKLDIAMQLILTPMIMKLVERRRRAL